MKSFNTFLCTAALALATAPVFANNWDDNIDVKQSIINDHTSDFVGTGYSPGKLMRGSGDTYGQALLDAQAGDISPSASPEKGYRDALGSVDTYGSVLNELGRNMGTK